MDSAPKFCSQCGSPLKLKFVEEENCQRLCCLECGFIAYLNPKIVSGAIVTKNGDILLLRRGTEPQKGFWTFPAGFLELGETVSDGAIRETREEMGVEIVPGKIFGLYSYADSGIVTVVYIAEVVGGHPKISKEASEIRGFSIETIPWDHLAFKSTRDALNDWIRLNR